MFAAAAGIAVILACEQAAVFAYQAFNRLDTDIAAKEKELFRLTSILGQKQELNTEYDNVISRYAELDDSDKVLQEIENIARKVNVNILNVKPIANKDEGTHKIYTIRIESQDEVASFARFLYALTEELKRIGVERLQITTPNKEELPKITLSLNAIALKDQ